MNGIHHYQSLYLLFFCLFVLEEGKPGYAQSLTLEFELSNHSLQAQGIESILLAACKIKILLSVLCSQSHHSQS